jgi:acyl-CoA synthetase (AMP-forming)/AMP-acid ligase II
VHSARVEQKHHFQTHEDNFLCIPPLYHTGAKMHWFGSLISGSKAVLLRGIKPEWILNTVSEEHCTIVWLLVPWAQDILDSIDRGDIKLKDYDLNQWRLMHIGAQPVPPSLIQRWMKVFPSHQYDTNYGLSESIGPGCVHLGVENLSHVGAIGVPGYGWEVKIMDEEGHEICECMLDNYIGMRNLLWCDCGELRGCWLYTKPNLPFLPPIYDNIEASGIEGEPMIFTLRGVDGYVKTDGTFIPMSEIESMPEDQRQNTLKECIVE